MRLNELHPNGPSRRGPIECSIDSFELAYRMQRRSEAFSLQVRPRNRPAFTDWIDLPRNCSASNAFWRRLVNGSSIRQLYHTTDFQPWDQHSDLKAGHEKCIMTNLPIARLLKDLKQRPIEDRW